MWFQGRAGGAFRIAPAMILWGSLSCTAHSHRAARHQNEKGTGAPPIPLGRSDRGRAFLLGRLRHGQDRDEGPALHALPELHIARCQRKDGVIAAHADILARPPFRAALAADDVAGNDGLAAEFLDAEPPPGAIAAVP